MATLCTGNYGLSQNCTDNGKEYFFVKFTDSAYRAVEDYHKNQGKHNTQATIQIVENGGVLSLPSSGRMQQFRFSIDEIEGSFECLKQTQNQLEVQGPLPYKLRIHANEDVYETTRHRMAVAEETQKNKCTREIKPNQTDIGRKVKLKNSSNRVPNIPPKRDQQQLLTSTASQSPLSSSTSSTTITSLNPVSTQQLSTGSVSSINLGSTFTTGNSTISSSSSSLGSNSSISSGAITGISSTNSAFSSISPLHTINTTLKNSNSNNNNLSTSILNTLTSNNNSTSSKHHSSYTNNNNNLNHNISTSSSANLTGVSSASSLSSALSSAAGSGTSGIASGYYSSNNGLRAANGMTIGTNSINNGGSRRNATGSGTNNRNQRNGMRHTLDITKKKIKDRLIHLLALKPYKKPELYARLQNEGVREREKASISLILKEISTIRDNTYVLKRQLWNDVNEDWPFYTEQELQMLKRRKPQNLTPPLSSDGGSSTSGQSPTSTHNGSPPPAVKRPSLDRDRFYEEPAAKKQRISHFRKDNNEINRWSRRSGIPDSRDLPNLNPRSRDIHDIRSSSYYGSNIPTTKLHQEPEDNAMSISYAVLGTEAARRISPREEIVNGHSNSNSSSNSHHHNIPNSHHHNANNNNTNSSNKNNSNNTIMSSSGNAHHKSPTPYSHQSSSSNVCNSGNNSNSSRIVDSRRKSSSSPMTTAAMNAFNVTGNSVVGSGVIDASSPGNGSRTTNMNVSIPMTGLTDGGPAINRYENSTNFNNNNVNQGSNNSGSMNCSNNSNSPRPVTTNRSYDFSNFTKICSVEQRRQYKAEFEKNYAEYRDLLNLLEDVAKKFEVLARQLEKAKSHDDTYKEIRRKILNEYEKTNRDRNHQKAKTRFNYLHAKLAHIKQLVHVFDQTLTSSDGNGIPNADMNQSPIQNIADFSGNVNISSGFNSSSSNNNSRSGGSLSYHRTSPIGSCSTGAQHLHHHLPENY